MQLSAGFVHWPVKRLVLLYALHYYGLGGTSAKGYKTKGLFCAALSAAPHAACSVVHGQLVYHNDAKSSLTRRAARGRSNTFGPGPNELPRHGLVATQCRAPAPPLPCAVRQKDEPRGAFLSCILRRPPRLPASAL